MERSVRDYLAEIGRRGGRKSRRSLDPEDAREMVRVREARRVYRRFHAECFWSFDPDYPIGLQTSDGSQSNCASTVARRMGSREEAMPLTDYQAELARLLSANRTFDSYLAGGAAILIEPNTMRYSRDLDYFHDSEARVAEAFSADESSRAKGTRSTWTSTVRATCARS